MNNYWREFVAQRYNLYPRIWKDEMERLKMSDPKTLARRDTGPKKLIHLAEESAELIQAICKAQTFGLYDCYDNGETNIEAIIREIADVKLAIHRWEKYFQEAISPSQIMKDFER